MKQILFVILFFISMSVFALPCPKTGNIIYKGDSIDDVKNACGKPDSVSTDLKVINKVQKWVYYRSQFYNQPNIKLSILIQNNAVVNIKAGRDNVTSTNLCGVIFSISDNSQQVLNACGEPLLRENLEVQTIPVTIMKYKGPPEV